MSRKKILTEEHNNGLNAHPYIQSNLKNFKNLIINGDFQIWQRGIIHNIVAEGKYTADRWYSYHPKNALLIKGFVPNFGSKANTLDIFGDGSCIATYTFDGNANDLSGKYNGTWYGTEQYDVGMFEQAAKFDGNSKIIVNNIPLPNNNVFTISMWLYNSQSNTNSRQGLFTTGDCEQNTTFRVSFFDGSVDFQYGTNGTVVYSEKVEDWIGKWIHLSISIGPNSVTIFKNSKKVFSQNGYNKTLDHKNKLHIGYSQWFFIGLIDQVRIFNRALTDEEVLTLMYESQPQDATGATYKILKTPDYSSEFAKTFVYRFEGRHLYPYFKKKSKLTLSFDFMSTRAGIYSVALINKTDPNNVESQIRIFNYDTPNAVQRISVTFNLLEFTNSAVNNDNNLGFELVIVGMTDVADYLVSDEGTYLGEKFSVSGGVRLQAGDYIAIHRVQLEEGWFATEFERIPYDIQLLRCMRYYEIVRSSGDNGNVYRRIHNWKIVKRVTPSVKIIEDITRYAFMPIEISPNAVIFNPSDSSNIYGINIYADAEL